jgi:hypothetical protein
MSTSRPAINVDAGRQRCGARAWMPTLALLSLVCGGMALPGCRKGDRLLLLDVRASGSLLAPVKSVRFSAPGWTTRSIDGPLGAAGVLFGYYGPPGDGTVTVTVDALDASGCVLSTGTVVVADTAAGKATPTTVVYVLAIIPPTCTLPDAGTDTATTDAADASDATDAAAASDAADASDG